MIKYKQKCGYSFKRNTLVEINNHIMSYQLTIHYFWWGEFPNIQTGLCEKHVFTQFGLLVQTPIGIKCQKQFTFHITKLAMCLLQLNSCIYLSCYINAIMLEQSPSNVTMPVHGGGQAGSRGPNSTSMFPYRNANVHH